MAALRAAERRKFKSFAHGSASDFKRTDVWTDEILNGNSSGRPASQHISSVDVPCSPVVTNTVLREFSISIALEYIPGASGDHSKSVTSAQKGNAPADCGESRPLKVRPSLYSI